VEDEVALDAIEDEDSDRVKPEKDEVD